MTPDVESPIEERLRAALHEVALSVTLDDESALWPDEAAPHRRTRARAFVAAGIAVVFAIGAGIAVKVATSNDATRRPVPALDTTTTRRSSTSGVSPAQQTRRDHPPKAGPFPDMTGVIDPKDVLHHSGGPFLTPRQAADVVLHNYQCELGGHAGADPQSECAQVDVRFFDRYSDFWAVEGGTTQFVGAWGADREMYVVTIFGRLPFTTTALSQHLPAYTPDRTFQIDATTGRVLMTGGYPLPEGFRGVETFRAP